MKSTQWISHFSESNANPTGHMICLRHVFKIRTFIKEAGGRTQFTVAFESDVLGNNGNVTWQYSNRADAEEVIMRIVAGIEEVSFVADNIPSIRKSQLFIDLIKGFDGGKLSKSRQA